MKISNGVKFNYQKICLDLVRDLPQRQKEVLLRRFALQASAYSEGGVERETLESIGRDLGVTRERVRQIEEDGLLKLKPKARKYQKIFQYFRKYLKKKGDLRKETVLLEELGSKNQMPQIYFLLNLGDEFERFGETDDFYSLWTINRDSLNLAKKVIDSFSNQLKESKKPLTLKDYNRPTTLRPPPKRQFLLSYLEISKKIQKVNEHSFISTLRSTRVNEGDFFGLKDWPEINPRGVKDKAYLVFKKAKKPLHFSEIASLIPGSLLQTVHNELIKDSRFVLVGRGVYALQEWGYYPGQIKEVISRVLEEAGRPLTKEEILEKVLNQRLVKENTILLNLSNKKYFLRNSQGKFLVNPRTKIGVGVKEA